MIKSSANILELARCDT